MESPASPETRVPSTEPVVIDFSRLKPIRNLPVVLQLQCGGCPTKVYVRARSVEAARDLALAGGWFIVGKHEGGFIPIWACPLHNPARTEFFGYQRELKLEIQSAVAP